MSIDVTQFLQTFFEESMEMLENAESVLLALDTSKISEDSVNQLFRIMHSIKGSSAIFQFDVITQLAHSLETFLESIRTGTDQLNKSDIELLLNSVDCIRSIIIAIQNKSEIDDSLAKKLTTVVQARIKGETNPQANLTTSTNIDSVQPANAGWDIKFNPPRNLFQQKTDPLRLFQILTELGKAEININISKLPKFPDFDPNECFLSWQILLHENVSKDELIEVFSWVTDISNVNFAQVSQNKNADDSQEILTKSKSLQTRLPSETSVRVSTKKIDDLINLIGELVITKSMLTKIIDNFVMDKLNKLKEGLETLEVNSRELQANVMRIRMVPIELVFNRFVRLVHDQANKIGKQVELNITGEQTEIDKNMIEKINDPLVHIIRNSLDHGVELPEVRLANNKPAIAQISLDAYQDGNTIVIEIADDGAGLNKSKIRAKAIASGLLEENAEISDEELYHFIFHPGFSTAEKITDLSGRGVGMDVVYKNINELGGEVEIETETGKGTIFRLRLPLTLAIMDCQLVKIGNQIFTIPLDNITELVKIDATALSSIDNQTNLYFFRNEYIPIIDLAEFFGIPTQNADLKNNCLIIVEIGNLVAGFVVGELLTQQQVVIKNLEENYRKIIGISGVTILGDGKVSLILDAKAIITQRLNPSLVIDKPKVLQNNMEEESEDNLSDMGSLEFLSFIIGDKEYGIDILTVKEIRVWEEASLLPNAPPYIKGVINLRGNIIPILDLYYHLGFRDKSYGRHAVVIILTYGTHSFGIVADQISDTHSIKSAEIKPLLDIGEKELKKYIRGLVTIDNKMVALLNTKYLTSIVLEKEFSHECHL